MGKGRRRAGVVQCISRNRHFIAGSTCGFSNPRLTAYIKFSGLMAAIFKFTDTVTIFQGDSLEAVLDVNAGYMYDTIENKWYYA